VIRYKWCCGANHAVLVAPLWPVVRDGIKWYTALYKCEVCHQYTMRGETNQLKAWMTFVKFLKADEALALMEESKRRAQTERESQ